MSISFSTTITQEVSCNFFLIFPVYSCCAFKVSKSVIYDRSLFLFVLCFLGRLCDGPSSPCRLLATSCWAPPPTLNICWRKRNEQRRVWCCHRKAGSGSCRACFWEKYPTDDGLEPGDGAARTHWVGFWARCWCHLCSLETFQLHSHTHLLLLHLFASYVCQQTLQVVAQKALLHATL